MLPNVRSWALVPAGSAYGLQVRGTAAREAARAAAHTSVEVLSGRAEGGRKSRLSLAGSATAKTGGQRRAIRCLPRGVDPVVRAREKQSHVRGWVVAMNWATRLTNRSGLSSWG
jgi:hypothetical protein